MIQRPRERHSLPFPTREPPAPVRHDGEARVLGVVVLVLLLLRGWGLVEEGGEAHVLLFCLCGVLLALVG